MIFDVGNKSVAVVILRATFYALFALLAYAVTSIGVLKLKVHCSSMCMLIECARPWSPPSGLNLLLL